MRRDFSLALRQWRWMRGTPGKGLQFRSRRGREFACREWEVWGRKWWMGLKETKLQEGTIRTLGLWERRAIQALGEVGSF